MRVVFLDKASMDRDDIDYSSIDSLHVDWMAYDMTTPGQVHERLKGAAVVITNKVILDDSVLTQADSLKLICIAATGVNNVDLDSARKRGIEVCNARGYATASVVEHVFGLLISLLRNNTDYQAASIDGRWAGSRQFCYLGAPISELSGKTIGIIGYGELGQAVAKVAGAFGMNVLVSQRPGSTHLVKGRHDLTDVLRKADVLTLHCPLNDITRNLIGKHAFSLMPQHAVLINTARGGIVNEEDLLNALKHRDIAAAALDVLLEEPPGQQHPLLQSDLSNLIVTPHVAWASQQARQRLLQEVIDNIEAFMQGRVRNTVL